jgi:hypothetical protein
MERKGRELKLKKEGCEAREEKLQALDWTLEELQRAAK